MILPRAPIYYVGKGSVILLVKIFDEEGNEIKVPSVDLCLEFCKGPKKIREANFIFSKPIQSWISVIEVGEEGEFTLKIKASVREEDYTCAFSLPIKIICRGDKPRYCILKMRLFCKKRKRKKFLVSPGGTIILLAKVDMREGEIFSPYTAESAEVCYRIISRKKVLHSGDLVFNEKAKAWCSVIKAPEREGKYALALYIKGRIPPEKFEYKEVVNLNVKAGGSRFVGLKFYTTLPYFPIIARVEEVLSELPSLKSVSPEKLNVRYPLIKPFAYAHIKWDEKEGNLIYILEEPKLMEKERSALERIEKDLIDLVDVDLTTIKSPAKALDYLEEKIIYILKKYKIELSFDEYKKIRYYVARDFIGLEKIEPLLRDPYIEDISCDGVNIPIYILHRRYGAMKTNIIFKDLMELNNFIIKIAQRCGRYISYAEPLLDGTLPDGSRVQATLGKDVTTRGPTFTIRKFREIPLSPVELIEYGTASPEIFAYLWLLVEYGRSILIAGGTATGKTTLLNAISLFIPKEFKIVSIEDTRELNLPHEHWIPGVTRPGFGPPDERGRRYGEVTMYDLLKESFRQRPDYVIVGEVRGKEAYVMFQGMASGHAALSTMHASSLETVLHRLRTPPINLSPTLIEALDALIVLVHAKTRGKAARRIKEIVEIIGMSYQTGEPRVEKVVKWKPVTDTFEIKRESFLIKKISKEKGIPLPKLLEEFENRTKVLEWMAKNGIRNFVEVSRIINQYHKNPRKVMEMIK